MSEYESVIHQKELVFYLFSIHLTPTFRWPLTFRENRVGSLVSFSESRQALVKSGQVQACERTHWTIICKDAIDQILNHAFFRAPY